MQNNTRADSFLSCPPSFMDLAGIAYDAVSLAIAMVAIPIGVVLATCGFRIRRATFFLCGFISGMFVTYSIIRDQIDAMQLPFEGAIGVAAAGGLVLGLLCLGVQVLGLFVVGMDAAFLLAAASIGVIAHFLTYEERLQVAASENSTLLFSSPFPSRWLPIGCIIFACLLGGLVSLLRPKYLLIIGSSLVGSAVIMLTFGYFLETRNPLRPIRFIAASIIGTRYMHTHYGKYLFRYIPIALPVNDEEQFSVGSYTQNTSNKGKSSTTPLIPTPEKEGAVLTFLCWSDFVLLVCWLLIASIFAVLQSLCAFRRHSHKRRSSLKNCKSRRHSASSSRHKLHSCSADKVCTRRVNTENRRHASQGHATHSHGDLPPYSATTTSLHRNSIVPHAEAWLSRNLDEFSNSALRQPSSFVPVGGVSNAQSEHLAAVKWMSVVSRPGLNDSAITMPVAVASSSAVLTTTSGRLPTINPVQSPVATAGHLLRMRRSLGDVLSRDFISTCVAPRPLPALGEHGSSQC